MNSSAPYNQLLHVPGAKIRQHLGKLYVVTAKSAQFNELKKVFEESSQDMALFPFTPVRVSRDSTFKDPVLAGALSVDRPTFVSLVLDPAEGMPVFLTRHTGDGILALEAAEFSFDVDLYMRKALSDFADGFLPQDGIASGLQDISFRGRRAPRISKEEKMKRLEEAKAAFVDNVKLERRKRDPKTTETIDLVINNLPQSSKLLIIRKYMDTLSEEEIQRLFEDSVDMKALAERSKVKIIVRRRNDDRDDLEHYEDVFGTMGEYRICYRFGNEEGDHLLDFKARADNAVYFCCLLIRREFGDRDIDFAAMEDLFIGAMRLIYGDSYENARSTFRLLLDEVDPISKRIKQGSLKNCISGIRDTIDKELLYKENPSIFYFQKNSHLGILARNIIVPDGLYEKVRSLGREPGTTP